jgi:hypothetical protein
MLREVAALHPLGARSTFTAKAATPPSFEADATGPDPKADLN